MNAFPKKSLHVALAGLGMLGFAGAASAVMVNPNGLGEVLIYPYYTVRSVGVSGNGPASYNTLLSVVNTTASTKAVKVRFREGKASKEVLDFNVFLSPRDVWTAAIVPDGDGAVISTDDRSCMVPTLRGNPQRFRTTLLSDVIGGGEDRTKEGYFEIFEMATYAATDPVAVGSKHSGGVPNNCGLVTHASAALNPLAPNGGLSGEASLINVLTGDMFSQDATALVQFWPPSSTGQYFDTADERPNYSNSVNVASALNDAGNIVTGLFVNGETAVTAALQRRGVINEFVLTDSTLSGTDWVITMPTKGIMDGALPFTADLTEDGACEPALLVTYNREEGETIPEGPDFSPTPTAEGFEMCWESTVLSFKRKDSNVLGSNVLGSTNRIDIDTEFREGWAILTFPETNGQFLSAPTAVYNNLTGTASSAGDQTWFGLPVIGFAVQTFVNGTLTNGDGRLIQSSYGGNWTHRYHGPIGAISTAPQ